jgi:hypothetical protein
MTSHAKAASTTNSNKQLNELNEFSKSYQLLNQIMIKLEYEMFTFRKRLNKMCKQKEANDEQFELDREERDDPVLVNEKMSDSEYQQELKDLKIMSKNIDNLQTFVANRFADFSTKIAQYDQKYYSSNNKASPAESFLLDSYTEKIQQLLTQFNTLIS